MKIADSSQSKGDGRTMETSNGVVRVLFSTAGGKPTFRGRRLGQAGLDETALDSEGLGLFSGSGEDFLAG